VLGLDDLRDDRGTLDLVEESTEEVIGTVPAPIAVVSDKGPCFRSETFATAFAGDDPLLRHVRTRVRSPQTNGVIERFFGALKYEHLYRAPIDDGDAPPWKPTATATSTTPSDRTKPSATESRCRHTSRDLRNS
jgi:putative transposase